ncbi:MAG: hydrogenase formation protein HypD [Verrucomicrobiales bacterium]|nr:hydrogenase formation protein HypD [Verrucomicrobiales bacterium]
MKHLDEYRDATSVRRLVSAIQRLVTRPWTIMEICGGQTHAIVRFGIDQMLPAGITLIHGPGCPVCVTPVSMIDRAIALAGRPEVILCSYGDMLRVPGSQGDLFSAKARGGDVRMVYSPLDCLAIAKKHADRQVVFFAVGFETTAPVHALAVRRARDEGVENFSLLVSQVLVPPAIEALLSSPHSKVQGFLAAGHVCTVMGLSEYLPLARRFRVPMVVTGFEPVDLLRGLLACLQQLESGRAEVENAYERAVREDGNPSARQWMEKVFCVTDREWRGIGCIPASGYRLRDEFAAWDAERRFPSTARSETLTTECWSGRVLQGLCKPVECPAFATRCTPDHPLGATMVSAEGACAAYYRYRR